MFFGNLKSSKPGAWLSVCPCPQFGLRPQVEISATNVRKHGKTLLANLEAESAKRPIAVIDHNGNLVAKSSNWPA